MSHSRTGKKRPARGKAERQEYISNKNKQMAAAQEEELSLTGMIKAVSDEMEAANDEMSITRMIETATDDAADETEGKTGELFGTGNYIQVPAEDEETEKETGIPRNKWLMYLSICLAVLALIIGIVSAINAKSPKADNETSESEEEISETDEETESKLKGLQDEISAYLSDAEGNWSVYLKDLKTGDSFVINDEQMPSASLIKLFTAGRYLEAVENGEIYETDDSAYCLTAMISWSDNDAWEALETYIGQGYYDDGLMSVTDFARRIGCERTGRQIGTESIYDYDADNLTAAKEVGYVLESIYNGTYVSQTASARLYDLLSQQAYVGKIPAGLPEGFESASKSGELPGIENDAAIIKGPDTDYVLVILSNDFYYSDVAVEDIVEVSAMCAHYLNPSIQ